MSKNTITIALQGNVPLADFAKATKHFHQLIAALTEEIAGDENIEWRITELKAGSAITGITGYAQNEAAVAQVANGYAEVGQAIADNRPIPYTAAVAFAATQLTDIINGNIKSIDFITDGKPITITQPAEDLAPDAEATENTRITFGAISGTAETLARRGLTFSLFDDIFDRAIICHFKRSQQEQMRKLWGKRIRVIGLITRDPDTGRPKKITRIQKIIPLSEEPNHTHRQARGIIPWRADDEPSEHIIRRLRDAS